MQSSPKWKLVLDSILTVAAIVLCVTLTWAAVQRGGLVGLPSAAAKAAPPRPEPPLPSTPIPIAGAPTRGALDAKIAIIEFSDFQCPYCGIFARTTHKELEKAYLETGQVLLAFRQLPLESLHSNAFRAAEASVCAARVGRFWEMHDALFANAKQLDEASIRSYAIAAGMKPAEFDRCAKGEATSVVKSDAAAASSLSVSGTPTFMIGTSDRGMVTVKARFSGAAPLSKFKDVIDSIVSSGVVNKSTTTATNKGGKE